MSSHPSLHLSLLRWANLQGSYLEGPSSLQGSRAGLSRPMGMEERQQARFLLPVASALHRNVCQSFGWHEDLENCSLTLLGFAARQGGFRGGGGCARVCVIAGFLEIRAQDWGEA